MICPRGNSTSQRSHVCGDAHQRIDGHDALPFSGLISASRTAASEMVASCDRASMASAGASRSALGLPRQPAKRQEAAHLADHFAGG